MIVNYFYEIDGAPMLAILQSKHDKQKTESIDLPKYISVFRECTDEPQYHSEAMCKEEYLMNSNDKTGTSPA